MINKKPFIIDIIKNLWTNAPPIKLHPFMLLIYKDWRNDRKLNVVINMFYLEEKIMERQSVYIWKKKESGESLFFLSHTQRCFVS